MKTGIVWFKTDLRVNDNETLLRAVKENEQVIPLYVLDDRLFDISTFGFRRCGAFRLKFLLESLHDLRRQLATLGAPLVVLRGLPETALPEMVSKYKVQKVYAKKEVADEELKIQNAVQTALWKLGCEFESYSTSTLYLATDLPFSVKDIPDLFTSYRKKVERDASVRPPLAAPDRISSPALEHKPIPVLSDLNMKVPAMDSRSAFPFNGGESAALQRLQEYIHNRQLVSGYKDTRNQLIGQDYSSKFSAWLALGCLSPRTIYQAVKTYEDRHGSNASTYWLIFELMWRDFFRFMMKKHHSAYFLKAGISGNASSNGRHDPGIFRNWQLGHTGVPFVDACMKELKLTGYLSNRGRQNVASYLVNDLKQDWRYGAAWFEEQLVDYDVCSNWGNWAYIAGVGNDARKDRYFNIAKQQQMYDPKGEYVRLWA